jgi:signal transduction histidine kinase
VFALPAAIGVTARERARAHTKELQNVRLGERAALARELHDTVAHHVAAIAIQAQAGRAVLALEPARAGLALTRIEDEAKDTLRELREIVGALRDVDVDDTGDARVFDIAPTSIVAALEALAQGSAVQVALAVEGDTDALSPALGRALHRIARESLTNVVRHARHARAIGLTLDARDPTRVVLTVDDDGEHATERAPGFGITGMRERATLLGGTLTAGPRDDARGWRVRATLPQSARERVGGSS